MVVRSRLRTSFSFEENRSSVQLVCPKRLRELEVLRRHWEKIRFDYCNYWCTGSQSEIGIPVLYLIIFVRDIKNIRGRLPVNIKLVICT